MPISPRQRVRKALNFEETDRVPIDLGSTNVTGIHIEVYKQLLNCLKLPQRKVTIANKVLQLAHVDDDVLKILNIDTRGVYIKGRPSKIMPDGTLVDEWQSIRKLPSNKLYYELISFPLRDLKTSKDLDSFAWPDPDDDIYYKGLDEEGKRLYYNTDYALVGSTTGSIFQKAQSLRGFDQFLLDLLERKDFALHLMSILTTFYKKVLNNFLGVAGKYLDVIKMADDLAIQDSLWMSPDLYREMIKPFHKKLFATIKKEAPNTKILFHSCGAIRPLIPDLIDAGIDILNPVQVSSKGMDAEALKKEFGKKIAFWGGIDTQHVLPYSNKEGVIEETEKRIKDLSAGGGYVLGAVHNIQPGVPCENILAMYQKALE